MLIIAGLFFTGVLFVVLGILGQVELGRLLDLQSLLLVVLPLLFFLWASQSGRTVKRYIKSSFKQGYQYSRKELERIVSAAKNTIKFTLAFGLFVFVFSLNTILSNLDFDEEGWFAVLVTSIQMNLLVIIYSFAISLFVFFPLKVWAENKIQTSSK